MFRNIVIHIKMPKVSWWMAFMDIQNISNHSPFIIYKPAQGIHYKQEPWRLPSRQAERDGTDSLRLDAHSDDQAVTGNQGYFEN